MSQGIESDDYIRRYLLGEVSEEEREQVEQRLLSDEKYYEQVRIAEEELAYDYVSDELPEQSRKSFRRHALRVPERREEVRFARALRKYVTEKTPREAEERTAVAVRSSWLESLAAFFRRPVVGLSLAAALLVAVALFAWTAVRNRGLRDELARLEAQRTPPTSTPKDLQGELEAERLRNAELAEQLRREQELRAGAERELLAAVEKARQAAESAPPARTGVATVVSFFLTPGGVRGSGDSAKISVPPGAGQVRLELDVAAEDYKGYRAVLKTVEGEKALLTRPLPPSRQGKNGRVVTLKLPARLLKRGDYQIELSGLTAAGEYQKLDTYSFRVAR